MFIGQQSYVVHFQLFQPHVTTKYVAEQWNM